MIIRTDQLKSLEEDAVRKFAIRVAAEASIRNLVPLGDSAAAFLWRVTSLVNDGREMGLTTEIELARYAFLILRLGPSPESREQWRKVLSALSNPRLDASERLDRAYAAWRSVRRRTLPRNAAAVSA